MGLLYRAADALRRRRIADDHGRVGEDLAHRYLRRHGCTIVARRYRPNSGGGEIDIVAWHRGTLVFVEVKARASAEFGPRRRGLEADTVRYRRHHPEQAAADRVAAGRLPAVTFQPPL